MGKILLFYYIILLLRLVTPLYTENNRHDIWELIFLSALALFFVQGLKNKIRRNKFKDNNDFDLKRSDH